MAESTKDMMRDDEDGQEAPFFVKLVLAKNQQQFASKHQLKDFIVQKCGNGISPDFIDFDKSQPKNSVILRFNHRLNQEYCVKALLDDKYNNQTQENKAGNIMSFMAPKQKQITIEKIDTLSPEEREEYLKVVSKDRQHYKYYLKRVKKWKKTKKNMKVGGERENWKKLM